MRNTRTCFRSATRLQAIAGAILLCVGATACGRSTPEEDSAGCLLLGYGRRLLKEDTVRVEFSLEHLVGVSSGDLVTAWSTVEKLGNGPRRLISVGKGSETEAPFIIYTEPGGPGEGVVYIDAGLQACKSLDTGTPMDGGAP